MKVLLTGASGFIGSHIARELLDRGHTVRVSMREGSDESRIADIAARLERRQCDVFAASIGELAVLGEGVELAIHAAWFAVPGKYLAARENLACIDGSLRLLDALASVGCTRAAFIGSCFEYDFRPGTLSEDGPVDPQSLYAAAKLATRYAGEQLAALAKIEFVWPRLFYQYGPHEDVRRLVPYVIQTLMKGEPVQLTQGLQVRDFLHVRDVASAVASIALSDLRGVVNVGSGRPVTVRDIVSTIERQLSVTGLAQFGARPDNPTDPPTIAADNRKLVSGTGWAPRFDLERGLADTIEWTRQNVVAP